MYVRQTLTSYIYLKASRGPWGAFALLWNDKGRHISSLGALIIILILFMEPFTQQIVSFYDCVEVDHLETGKIPRTNFINRRRASICRASLTYLGHCETLSIRGSSPQTNRNWASPVSPETARLVAHTARSLFAACAKTCPRS